MRKPRILTNFRKYTNAGMEAKAQNILACMTGNDYFTTPTPPLADVSDRIKAYSEALAVAIEGSRLQIAKKNDARKALENILVQLGAYVTLIADGDRTILLSSGYDLAKDGEPRPPIGAPKNLRLSTGLNPGEIVVEVDSLGPGIFYAFEYTLDPLTEQSTWKKDERTKCKFTFKDMQAGQRYWIRVAAIAARDQKVYSGIMSIISQ